MKLATKLFGLVVFVASLAFVVIFAREHWPEKIEFSAGQLLAAAALYALTHITTTLAWAWTLRATGSPIPLAPAFRISLLSQVGKYLPGNAAHHLGRAALAKRVGVPLKVSALIFPLEIGIVCFAALMVGGFIVSKWISIACVAGLTVLLFSKFRPFVGPVLALALGLLLAGASIAVMLGDAIAVAAYPIAWLAGFLLPGAPAGLGVREAALLGLLDGRTNADLLVSAAIVHRVLTAVVDGLAALYAFASIHRRAPNSLPTTGSPDSG